MGKHKVHRSEPWKRDTLLFTCILRIRVQPSVPYPIIAYFLINEFPDVAQKLANKTAPRELRPKLAENEDALREWLEGYLEERYDLADDWCSQPWQVARDWEADRVERILGSLELDKMGYEVRGDEEMRLHLEWRKKGDWKRGSEPLGRQSRPMASIVYSIQENVPDASKALYEEKQRAWVGEWATEAQPSLTALENVPQLPSTFLEENHTAWGRTMSASNRDNENVPDIFDASIDELQRLFGWTLGAGQVPEPRPKLVAIESQQPSSENELERRRWTEHRQRIDRLVQRLEIVQQKYRDTPPAWHYESEKQQSNASPLTNQRLFRPKPPRIQTSFNHQLEDIEHLEQLIHEHKISGDVSSPASKMPQYDVEQGRTLLNMTGYGGDSHWVEMGSPS